MHRMQSVGRPYFKFSRDSSKAPSLHASFFVQLFLIQGLYIVIVIINHHVLLVWCANTCVHLEALEVLEVLMDKA